MYAKIVAKYIASLCRVTFDKKSENMESTIIKGNLMDVFDHKGYFTHKYIPKEKINKDLGEPEGAGVFGAWLMADGPLLLMTCKGKLAYWSGKTEDAAEWRDDLYIDKEPDLFK